MSTCNKVHIDVQQLVSKYQILGEPTTTTGQRLKRAWKRLILEPEDIKELRLRITSTIGLANVSIAVLTSKTTSTIHNQVFEVNQKASQISVQVDKVVDTQELERRQALLSWISDTDHEAFLADALSRRQMGTGKWFLNGEAFQNWLNGEESSIFLAQGDPGTGKTIMAAIVIEYLQARIVTDDNIGLAHFFCDFNRTNDSLTIVTSILRQLLNYQSSPEDVNADLYRLQLEGKKLDMVDTKTNLSKIMRGYSKVFLILDALDECEISHLKRIIPILLDPQAHGKVRLIATCRPVPEILQLFPTATVKLLQADTEDIEAYLLCVGQEMRVVQRMPQLLNSIIYAIIKAVDRMYVTNQTIAIS